MESAENPQPKREVLPKLHAKEGKSSYGKFVVGFLVILVLAFAADILWNRYVDTRLSEPTLEQKYEQYMQAVKRYEDAQRADTYGGKTPQETIDLFVAALKQGDVELASKYFVIQAFGTQQDPKWLDGLQKAKDEGRIVEITNVAQSLIPSNTSTGASTSIFYVKLGMDGIADRSMHLQFNKYSGVWKIESF
jgi:hypothetical protein